LAQQQSEYRKNAHCLLDFRPIWLSAKFLYVDEIRALYLEKSVHFVSISERIETTAAIGGAIQLCFASFERKKQ
jgi:hypothetical protein